MLRGRKIILGVSGSIAAYKSATLIRLLTKAEAEVQVIMTPGAADFITPLTLSTLSKRSVLSAMSDTETGSWNSHVDLGMWADAIVIAPASANTMAKMAAGICDNLLLATCLSARCPVFIAPAMDLDMYAHPATKKILEQLRSYGNHFIDPSYGSLASGLTGTGRMAEPEEITARLETCFAVTGILHGKRALVTAGPTWEAIDPVRFISNHSTGKMGFALAQALAEAGAMVDLVTGPTHEKPRNERISITNVISADDMYKACRQIFPVSDIAVLSAAVADFRPSAPATAKIKKSAEALNLQLTPTTDIASELGKMKTGNQLLIGFALETENEIDNAKEKLSKKNMDIIVLNSLRDAGAGFGHDTNKVTILERNGKKTPYGLRSKTEVAGDIIRHITAYIHE